MTHPSFTLMFCITSNPCAFPLAGVREDMKLVLSAVSSIDAIKRSLASSLPLNFVIDNAEEGRYGKQSGIRFPKR